jgi:hypothetical protein
LDGKLLHNGSEATMNREGSESELTKKDGWEKEEG